MTREDIPPQITRDDIHGAFVSAINQTEANKYAQLSLLQRRAKRLRESWFVVGLEALGLIGLIFAVGLFVYDLQERQDERIARAWQLVTTQAPGNSGKVEALEYLNSEYGCPITWGVEKWCWKKRIPLNGVDVSSVLNKGPVILYGLDLSGAELENAKFDGAVLINADFTDADLEGASFVGTDLMVSTFENANIGGADFTCAHLSGVDFLNTSYITSSNRPKGFKATLSWALSNTPAINLPERAFERYILDQITLVDTLNSERRKKFAKRTLERCKIDLSKHPFLQPRHPSLEED
ncbi:pentapeptide repeat-containing protein [Roseibium alexandrii]|uniref:pentapeptide repeat-containing protein n=1 Tax=Roseibium alexandrii TaxID=388408 RepID=UPI0016405FC4|nr:pentapeptide repeat-containing protein [Roseibium alexandrii]